MSKSLPSRRHLGMFILDSAGKGPTGIDELKGRKAPPAVGLRAEPPFLRAAPALPRSVVGNSCLCLGLQFTAWTATVEVPVPSSDHCCEHLYDLDRAATDMHAVIMQNR